MSKSKTVVWAILSVLTLVSFGLSRPALMDDVGRPPLLALVLLAAVKMKLVASRFMELDRAPRLLRGLLDAWIVGVAVLIIVLI